VSQEKRGTGGCGLQGQSSPPFEGFYLEYFYYYLWPRPWAPLNNNTVALRDSLLELQHLKHNTLGDVSRPTNVEYGAAAQGADVRVPLGGDFQKPRTILTQSGPSQTLAQCKPSNG
jgi:hypothetical protein